jgi:hypothetical protein
MIDWWKEARKIERALHEHRLQCLIDAQRPRDSHRVAFRAVDLLLSRISRKLRQ